MEQGIASGGSGDVYALHTTMTMTPAENEGDKPTVTFSSVELREDGLPMWLIVDDYIDQNNNTYARIAILDSYNNEFFLYSNDIRVVRSTGEVRIGNGSGETE